MASIIKISTNVSTLTSRKDRSLMSKDEAGAIVAPMQRSLWKPFEKATRIPGESQNRSTVSGDEVPDQASPGKMYE